ncbi:MAG: hypothetical protein XD91_1575 [Clostridiales bacterium 38_11]|nr:MAG: hypothetical protein XD91_1575 [Clostridiales bacterium 38_11]
MAKGQKEKKQLESHSELENYYDWCSFSNPLDFQDSSFTRILNFFLFETPAENTSCRSKSLKEYGWSGKGCINTIKSKLLKTTIGYDNYQPTDLDILYD